ncbi:hypothetical protein AAC03nite_39730 [Alicyclobacillus acidoterrestris]|nr:hypothetical protein AAC03nite_39730 [Alicyclobacillus acidoterrestris]
MSERSVVTSYCTLYEDTELVETLVFKVVDPMPQKRNIWRCVSVTFE